MHLGRRARAHGIICLLTLSRPCEGDNSEESFLEEVSIR
jgi:hypothetical protein